MSETKTERQPKIYQRMLLRFAIGLFIITGLILGYRWFANKGVDLGDLGTAETAGWIVAVERNDTGSQVVVIKPNGDVLRSPGYKPGVVEREPVWRPDGNQVFFISDRDKKSFNLFRWNLASNQIEQRTHGSFAHNAPSFPPKPNEDGTWTLLTSSAGLGWEIDPKALVAEQALPYSETQRSTADAAENAEKGSDNSVGQLRVRKVMWGKDRLWIVGVRRIESDFQIGEALVVQPMDGDPKLRTPKDIAFGERIDFDINLETGQVVYAVQGFQFPPPRDKDEAEVMARKPPPKPYLHYVVAVDPLKTKEAILLAESKNNKECFGSPRVAPSGSVVAVLVGRYGEEGFESQKIQVLRAQGDQAGGPVLAEGNVFEPSWYPDSKSLLFMLVEAGVRNIYSIDQSGSKKRISDGKTNYSSPQVSPQTK